MKDVAEIVGVSIQTVSAVINNKPGITAETRDRVFAVIEQLGYRTNSIARSLRTRQTCTIALILSDVSSPFIGRLAVNVEDYVYSRGYRLILYNTHDDVEREYAYMKDASERDIDGVLFISATDQCKGLDILCSAGIPYVALDRIPDPYNGPSVTLDNVKAGRLIAEHLLWLGHRNIAHISGPSGLCMTRERLLGFQQALEAQGMSSTLHVESAYGWDFQSGYQAMQHILVQGFLPTAVFSAGDLLAIGAMLAIREAGLKVPEDISIVGVDDIDINLLPN
jgi:LacI family transcriptional regulator